MKKKVIFIIVSISVFVMGGMCGLGGWFGDWLGEFGAFDANDDAYAKEGDEVVGTIETSSGAPPLYIKAVNPGYTEGDLSNVGEMVEIARRDGSNEPISLANVAVGYTNSSGKYSILFGEFPENSWMIGENILLRLAGSLLDGDSASGTYGGKGIPQEGGVTLLFGEEVLDAVCFRGQSKTMRVTDKEGAAEVPCLRAFKSEKPSVIVFLDGEFQHVLVSEYEVVYDEGNYVVILDEAEEEPEPGPEEDGPGDVEDEPGLSEEEPSEEPEGGEVTRTCYGLEFSEILTYFENDKSEQFLELHNFTGEEADLAGCFVGYKGKLYGMSGTVPGGGYFAYRPEGFSFTKNPASFNEVSLVDAEGAIVDVLRYEKGQKKGVSLIFVGFEGEDEVWLPTCAPTPGAENVYQEFRACEEGKVINPLTGNCVKDEGYGGADGSSGAKICPAGSYLNLATNRCNKIAEVSVKTCPEGSYLNPATNRCNKIATAKSSSVTECKEGYYLNPETGRCKKIQENTGAEYGVLFEEEERGEKSSNFVGLVAVLVVVVLGVSYVIYEFRVEIVKILRKVFRLSR